MALPNADQNIVGCQVSNQDLGLTVAASANVSTQTSNVIVDECPRSVIVLASIVSGTLTLSADIAESGTPAFSSPVASVTLTGSASAGFIKFNTTSSALRYAVRLTSTSANVDRFCVLDLGKLSAGEDAPSVVSGQRAFESSVIGDGSGAFPITV